MNNKPNRYWQLAVALLLISTLALTGCAPKATAAPTPAPPTPSPTLATTTTETPIPSPSQASTTAPAASPALKTFTAAELAKFDGLNGHSAYVAVDGIVYDVTKVPEWAGGSHVNRFQAGKDYSAEFANAPHNKVVFDGVPVVGTYVK